MDRKQIEQAMQTVWNEYRNDKDTVTRPSENFEKGFIAGVEWRINSVWHDVSERPGIDKYYLAQFANGAADTFCKSENWEHFSKVWEIKRWAYIEDLIPERKETGQ